MFYLVGLGNPGDEYKESRHNAGRLATEAFRKKCGFPEWEFDKKSKSQVSKSKISNEAVTLIAPDTFMNKSGSAVSYFIKPVAKAPKGKEKGIDNLVVIYDDIDLPIGDIKISYNRGTGGHRGLDSIVKAVKTKAFTRIRIGISPHTPKGVVKKPGVTLSPKAGEKAVLDFILGKFKPSEVEILKPVFKKVAEAALCFVTDGRDSAMNKFN